LVGEILNIEIVKKEEIILGQDIEKRNIYQKTWETPKNNPFSKKTRKKQIK